MRCTGARFLAAGSCLAAWTEVGRAAGRCALHDALDDPGLAAQARSAIPAVDPEPGPGKARAGDARAGPQILAHQSARGSDQAFELVVPELAHRPPRVDALGEQGLALVDVADAQRAPAAPKVRRQWPGSRARGGEPRTPPGRSRSRARARDPARATRARGLRRRRAAGAAPGSCRRRCRTRRPRAAADGSRGAASRRPSAASRRRPGPACADGRAACARPRGE